MQRSSVQKLSNSSETVPENPALTPQLIRRTAIDLLSRREHSRLELRRKLEQRFGNVPVLEQILEEMLQQGWASDRRFTENYLRMRSEKGYGPLRIRQELRERGITDELIATFLNENNAEWFQRLRQVWEKRFKGRHPRNYAEKGQQLRFLQYRGFSPENIARLWEEGST